MTRLVQLSDTHLSHVRGFFVDSFRHVAARLAVDPPDLIVVSGDISLDGADSSDDLAFSRHMLDALPAPVLALPGNHDVGEEPHAAHTNQPADEARRARYLAHFAEDGWCEDVPGWRLIGLNAHLFGTGFDAEAAQRAAFEDALAGADGRAIGVFLHKPLFIASPDETPDQGVSVPAGDRDWLLAAAAKHEIRFFASGHLHQGLQRDVSGVRHIWAPSTAFRSKQARREGSDTRLGYVTYDLGEDGGFDSCLVFELGIEGPDYEAIKQNGRYPFLKDVPPSPSDEPWPA